MSDEKSKVERLEELISQQNNPNTIVALFAELDAVGLPNPKDLTEAFNELAIKLDKKLVVNVDNRQGGVIINWAAEPMVVFNWVNHP